MIPLEEQKIIGMAIEMSAAKMGGVRTFEDINEIASDLGFLAGYYRGKLRAQKLLQLGSKDLFLSDEELEIKSLMHKMGYEND